MKIWLKKIEISQIQDGGRTPYWKSFFWLYLGAIFADQCEIWNRDEGSHADIGYVTNTAIFANSRWRTAAILKIALSPYLSHELTNFDQIWYAVVDFNSHDGNLTKSRNFSNSRWRTDAILKVVFWLYLGILIGRSTRNLAQKWRITCRYRSRDQNCNFRTFKMADVRHFENSFISISQPWIIRFRSNLVRDTNFHSEHENLTKIKIFQIQDGGRTPYWKSFFWPYLGAILADLCKFRNTDE